MGVLLTERSEADKRRGAFPGGGDPVFSDCPPGETPIRPTGMEHRPALGTFVVAATTSFVSNRSFGHGAFLQQENRRGTLIAKCLIDLAGCLRHTSR
jgi:hypothetical protein